MTDICFLTYMNRSGSTLLAEKLDRLSEVCVSLEPDIRDGLGEARGLVIRDEDALEDYLDEIYRSHKFSKWGIDREALSVLLLQGGFPITFREILPAILSQYCGTEEVRLYVFKNNEYFRFYAILREMFPASKFIFVARDPRGIFNSEKQAVDSAGRPMRRNLAVFAAHYVRTHDFIEMNLRGKTYFHYLRYEDLVQHEAKVLRELEGFLGISCDTSGKEAEYFRKIPENQKHLHRNLADGEMKTRRISAWDEELEPLEISFLQTTLGRYLAKNNYTPADVSALSPGRRLALIGAHLHFLAIFVIPRWLKKTFS